MSGYRVASLPAVLVIDPITGAPMRAWHGFLPADRCAGRGRHVRPRLALPAGGGARGGAQGPAPAQLRGARWRARSPRRLGMPFPRSPQPGGGAPAIHGACHLRPRRGAAHGRPAQAAGAGPWDGGGSCGGRRGRAPPQQRHAGHGEKAEIRAGRRRVERRRSCRGTCLDRRARGRRWPGTWGGRTGTGVAARLRRPGRSRRRDKTRAGARRWSGSVPRRCVAGRGARVPECARHSSRRLTGTGAGSLSPPDPAACHDDPRPAHPAGAQHP